MHDDDDGDDSSDLRHKFTLVFPLQVVESLVIEYDSPGVCDVSVPLPAKSSSATIKREVEEKYTVSTDDLTCNLCGQEYEQWTQLKKHLLDHILIAQNSAEGKAKVGKM